MNASTSTPNPLAPPRLLIPDPSIQTSAMVVSPKTPMDATPTTPVEDVDMKENVGRWSDEEHQLFLEGLDKHGKQWKTIATMIGTRTVVQVRTHAQKYFQKMERKTSKKETTSIHSPKSTLTKRKSFPTTLPSRKKVKSPKKSRASISLANLPASPPPELPSVISHSSSASENLSTISPTGVSELDLHMISSSSTTWGHSESSLFLDADMEKDLVEDPLEWLIGGGGMQHLPESSLETAPMFPDFQDESLYPALPVANAKDVIDDALVIADPKVTVQSLFLEEC